MNYVAVLGLAPTEKVAEVSFKYFDNYLVSIGEPLLNKSWTLFQINRQMIKIIKMKKHFEKKYNPNAKIYLDSGGFQLFMGYVPKNRVKEYVDVYHYILKKHKDFIDDIFSLDIMNRKWSKDELIKLNDYSISESINLIKKVPEIADKQLFIVQTRTTAVFDLWRYLMDKHDVYKYYTKYSFGGLVGLKKETNAKFSHVVPFTLWLVSKIHDKNGIINHLHYLGQSSKLAIFSGILMEKIMREKFNLDFKITMDSSELIRFTRIEQKLPIVCKNIDDFELIRELKDLEKSFRNHSTVKDDEHDFEERLCELTQKGNLQNYDFVDFMCQNINGIIELSHKIIDNINTDDLLNMNIEQIKELHPVFAQGRFAVEIYNNFQLINKLLPYVFKDTKKIEEECEFILKNY